MSSPFPSTSIGRASGSKLAVSTSTTDAPVSSTPTSPTPLGPSSTHPLLASTPSSSSITHQAPPSPEQAANLPYQARKRTPGGSMSSTLSTSPVQSTALPHTSAPHTDTTPLSPTHAPSHPSIVPLFSNPVVPTLSTSQLDSSGLGPAPGESSPTASSSAATIRLKLTSLKAEAQQGVGLSNDSFGMKMLETMVQKGGEDNWKETMELVTGKGKMTLLLPRANQSNKGSGLSEGAGGSGSVGQSATLGRSGSTGGSAGEVTVEMVREHLIFCDGGKKDGAIVVTLTGLVGRMEEESLTFIAFIPTDGPLMASLIDPITRSQALASLALPLPSPIPTMSTSSFGISHPFPSLIPLNYSSVLPFPPALPPVTPVVTRPRATSSVLPGMTVVPSRNPFAGLFGRRPATPAPAAAPTEEKPASRASSPAPDLLAPPTITMGENGTAVPESEAAPAADGSSIDRPNSRGSIRKAASSSQLSVPGSPVKDGEVGSGDKTAEVDGGKVSTKEDTMVSAWGVDKAIRRPEIEKMIGRAMRTLVEKELDGLPSAVVLAVKRFVSLSHPVSSHSRSHPPFPAVSARAKRLSSVHNATPTLLTIPPPASYSDSEACSNTYQAFFDLVHDELESTWSKGDDADLSAAERDKKERELEAKVVEAVNRVEGVVTRWGYNLLFSPTSSNDSKHDVALASRVAALCMLDLSLDHLGVVTYRKDGTRNEEVVKGLDEVMKSVGDEFKLLESASHQTPKAKCDVLVRAHKIVIDGLRSLPPIRLRPENEDWTPPAQAPNALSPTSSTHSSPLRPTKNLSLSLEPTPEEVTEEKTPRGLGSAEWRDAKEGEEVPSLVLEGSETVEDTSALKTPGLESKEDTVMSPITATADDEAPPAPAPASSGSSIISSVLSNESEALTDSGGGSSGADLLLPLLIFAVVKSNPSKLVSHLLYIQRYRANMCFSGESSYALVNVTAVVDFLENVNPGSLGLGGSDKVLSVELPPIDLDLQKDLSPLSSSTSSATSATSPQTALALALQTRLRGRVTQVGELASSGLTNVVDSGLGALRSLIGTSQALGGAAAEGLMVQVPGASSMVAATGLMAGTRPPNARRASGFSIASITASVAGIGSKDRVAAKDANGGNGNGKEWGAKREMVDYSGGGSSSSRPGSVYDQIDSDEEGSSGTDRAASDVEDAPLPKKEKEADTRSVRSVSSFRSAVVGLPSSANLLGGGERAERMSISERLATVGSGGGGASSPSSVPKSNPFPPPPASSPSPSRGTPTSLPATSISPGPTPTASNAAATHSRRASLLSNAPYAPPPSSLPPLPRSTSSSPAPSLSLGRTGSGNGSSAGAGGNGGVGEGEVAPPNERFLACQDAGDLRLGEVEGLLKEYRRVVGVLKEVGVWD